MIQTFNPLRMSRTLGLLFALILTALSGAFTLSAQLSIAKDGTAESGPNKKNYLSTNLSKYRYYYSTQCGDFRPTSGIRR